MTAQLTSVLTVNSTKNKQRLARRNSRKDICFYKVNTERAGLFCWKWFSSSLAVGPFRAWLVEWRNEVDWLSAGSTGRRSLRPRLNPGGSQTLLPGPGQSALSQLTSVTNKTCVRDKPHCPLPWQYGPPPWKTLVLVCARVYHQQLPHFC